MTKAIRLGVDLAATLAIVIGLVLVFAACLILPNLISLLFNGI